MAALGNLALLLDVTSPRTGTLDHRKARFLPSDVVLNLFKKDHHHTPQNSNPYHSPSIFTTRGGIEFEKETTSRNHRREVGARARKSNSKVSEGSNGNGYEDDDDDDDDDEDYDEEVMESRWEKMGRQRSKMKEVEEMRELEKKAEELQDRLGDDGGGEGDKVGIGEGVEETEEQKRLRVKRELEKVAREQAERRKTAQLMFDLGQKAYGKGAYGRSIEFLEGALTIIPRLTLFGGEIQIWLAMAYEANQRHDDCIDLYEQLEKKHPSISIRRQAAELKYILQAPKLKISQEEMVTIPLLNSYDSYASYWTDKNKDREERSSGSTGQVPWGGKDYLAELLVWRPPKDLAKNRAFWATLVLWLGLVGAALFLQG